MELSISKEKLYRKSPKSYSLADMVQKYETVSLGYPQWLAAKMILNGGEVALQLDSFYDYFGTQIFRYLDSFKEVRVVGETKQSSLKLKVYLKNMLPNVQFPASLSFYTEEQAVDAVYAVAGRGTSEFNQSKLISDILYTLKDQGVFYLTFIVKDYDVAIHQLYKEFDSSYTVVATESIEFLESKLYLGNYFNSIEVSDFTSTMAITNVDDLIAYILSDDKYDQLKVLIAQNGLSKFRNFLIEKIQTDGSLLVERQIKLLTCYK